MSKDKKEVKEHELKIWPEYFDDVESGRKTFEVRKLDRLFGKGDTLFLREWSPIKGYSGRETRKVITYVMAGGQWGLAEGNCILGIQPLPEGSGEVGLRWVTELTHEQLLKVLRKVSLLDLSDCEFEYSNNDDSRLWINAILRGRVIDAIEFDGNIFWMMNNDGSFAPLNPMRSAFEALEEYTLPSNSNVEEKISKFK